MILLSFFGVVKSPFGVHDLAPNTSGNFDVISMKKILKNRKFLSGYTSFRGFND
ncbi:MULTISPECIES: hypothetical protein [Bacillus]|uniref:hypothetical protein n=1 Tax=Bacillus TaxID=1386 RepID=UPI002244A92F|nr:MULTISPECIES: hypothetical protein [Bacillus]MDN5386652.1 hypothetical protein [Bacillus sp. LB7]MEC1024065.1 hypothetical protein [Bacillus paralicheniformis]MEC1024922.1 hypothetical protein [Bacillus paralicheniformis]MEC1033641.1 hypothetical protein [Bacillus paralicheniformis]MEC1051737.1 hypothetical protein [Bacillus paralicheniformis]